MRISDWSSDVCSSDLRVDIAPLAQEREPDDARREIGDPERNRPDIEHEVPAAAELRQQHSHGERQRDLERHDDGDQEHRVAEGEGEVDVVRSEEHTSELQSLMRISYAVFCLKKK